MKFKIGLLVGGMLLGIGLAHAQAQTANATANAPAYAPGTQSLSQDLSGNLRVLVTSSGTAGLTPVAGLNGTSVATAVNALPTQMAISSGLVTSTNPFPVYQATPTIFTTATGSTPVQTATAAASLVAKATPGLLYSAYISGPSVAGFLLVFNATSVPADGTVTPVECVAVASAGSANISNLVIPEFFSAGISLAFSSTGCFTKTTTGLTAFLHATIK